VYSKFTILIADRNRHVREFLRRELVAEDFLVEVARDGREVLTMIDVDTPPDLLILDLDIPFVNGLAILERLQDRARPLPVVIHSFLTEYVHHPAVQRAAAFVEKKGNIDRLKAVVVDVLRKWYPHRLAPVPGND
jgi:DNA-binding response OmpR family regulator